MMNSLSGALNSRNQAGSPTSMIKNLMRSDSIKNRFDEVMGAKAPQFMASITNLVNSNRDLQNVDAMSVVASAMVAATLDLPIDPNLGYMYIVPYRGQAQPQMGYKGYIQLALRTGQYKHINALPVYDDEVKSWNPLTEELEYESSGTSHDNQTPAGYVGYFQLINGFEKTTYWTYDQINSHRQKFSKMSSKTDPTGVWKSNFDAMALKTVLRNLISKWGIMSIEMQQAFVKDERPQEFDHETGEIQDVQEVEAEEENVAPETQGSTDKKEE